LPQRQKAGIRVLRKELASLAQKDIAAISTLRKAHRAFTFMSREDKVQFIDRMEKGLAQPTKVLNDVSRVMRKLLDERRDKIISMGKGYLENWIENYFPHIWKNEDAKKIIGKIMGRRRFAGTKSFLKQRTIPYTVDGINAGLEPVSYNPVDLVLLRLHEMDRFIMAAEIIKELKEKGLLKFVYSRSKKPDGYVRIDDPAFTIFMKPEITKKEAYDYHLVEQLLNMARMLGIDTKRFVSIGGKMLGYTIGEYGKTGGEKVVTRYATPESVLAHEIGHVLGYRYRLYDTLRRTADGEWTVHKRGKKAGERYFKPTKEALELRRKLNEQWRKLADMRFESIEATQAFQRYVRNAREKEAVMLEALIHAPDKFKEVAPDLYREFTKFLNSRAELRPLLDIKPSLVIGESIATIKVPGFTTLGYYMAPEEVGLLLNNYLSPGLINNNNKIIASTYNLLRGAGNILNQVQLSLSAFHGLNVTTDMMNSTLGLGLRKLTIRDQRMSGLKDILTTPIAPVIRTWEGARIRKAYKQSLDSMTDEKMKQMVDMLIKSGGRAYMDAYYYNKQIKALEKTFADILHGTAVEKTKGLIRLPFNIVGSALEALAKPLMEWYVPAGKIGIWSAMAKSEMQRLESGEINEDQFTDLLIKAWDSADNRMGQLVYDNMFWNKIFKDLLMLSVRSTGWSLGSWREYGGAIKDIATTKRRLSEGDKILSYRMAYTIGALTVYAVLGAVIMRLLTGEDPEELKDYFFPRTGNKNPDGSDERLSLPTYAKDWYAYGTQPITTLIHKQHPMWGLIGDIVTNKDFYNVKIRNEDDPIIDQMKEIVTYITNQARPISIKNFEKMQRGSDDKLRNAVISITGITSAPGYITKTRAQKLLSRYMTDKMPVGAKSKEDFEHLMYRRTIINKLRQGMPIDKKEAIDKLGYDGYYKAKEEARTTSFYSGFKRLGIREAINVYIIANDKEREEVKYLLRDKLYRYRDRLTREEYNQAKELL